MKGLEAIAFYNGWNISATGVCIVFTALVSLSFIISQLHKCLTIWEKRDEYIKKAGKLFSRPKKKVPRRKIKVSENFNESARQFHVLTQSMKDPFSLPKLIMLAKKIDLGRPHSTVNALLSARLIVPDGKGLYYWDHDVYTTILEKE
ncbi:MAG: OadG family protein [Desulfobacteraceae bacterium]|nr:OadG family protein [Desulfobacteraceae bacterium]MBC2757728.1 OadG family protein [Desulfobacteraceae bacterium]